MITRRSFGVLPGGSPVEQWSLEQAGLELRVTGYGATIVSLFTPDRDGHPGDIVLGCESLEGYLSQPAYLGALVGRDADRIAAGRFTLDGRDYQLATNWNGQHLHGGERGFDKLLWQMEPIERDAATGVRLSRTSPAGEEGYPGTLRVTVEYLLTNDRTLEITYAAETDAPTPVNLTQHTYFNLAGHDSGDVLGHGLRIAASSFTPIDEQLIPLGGVIDVAGTAFDFREERAIGACIEDEDEQLERGYGYDHNFVLDDAASPLHPAAELYHPRSGRTMTVRTSQPGLQLYTGNFLDGQIKGKNGCAYGPRAGLCLETQHFPNSPNVPSFPSTVVRPGTAYGSRTVFAFGVRA